jgi:hypothetical protein
VVCLTVYDYTVCRAAGWATLRRDDDDVLHNMQAYLHNLLAAPADTSAAQGWSLAQRMLVGTVRLQAP